MHSLGIRFPQKLSRKSFWLLWLFAFGLQLFRTYTFDDLAGGDRQFQIMVGYHTLIGKGPVAPDYFPPSLEKPSYHVAGNFPLGYSLLVLPFYLTTGDWTMAMDLVHGLSLFSLMLILGLILRDFWRENNAAAQVLCLMIWGFSFAPWQYAGSTDLLACAFLLGAMRTWMNSGHEKKIQRVGISFFLLSLAAFFRYAYYIYLIVPFLFELITQVFNPHRIDTWTKIKIRPLIKYLALAAICFLPLYAIQKSLTSASSYFDLLREIDSPRWIFPEHLLMLDNFFLKAFCYLSTEKLASIMGIPSSITAIVGWLLVVGVLAMSINRRGIQRLNKNESQWMLVMGILLLLTLGLLVGLSLMTPPQFWKGNKWTYVGEGRYFLPIMLLLILAWVSIVRLGMQGKAKQITYRVLSLSLLAFMVIHSSYRFYTLASGIDRDNTRYSEHWNHQLQLKELLQTHASEDTLQLFVLDIEARDDYNPEKICAALNGYFPIDWSVYEQYKGKTPMDSERIFFVKEQNLSTLMKHFQTKHILEKTERLAKLGDRILIKCTDP